MSAHSLGPFSLVLPKPGSNSGYVIVDRTGIAFAGVAYMTVAHSPEVQLANARVLLKAFDVLAALKDATETLEMMLTGIIKSTSKIGADGLPIPGTVDEDAGGVVEELRLVIADLHAQIGEAEGGQS